jgi:hypothetical protein
LRGARQLRAGSQADAHKWGVEIPHGARDGFAYTGARGETYIMGLATIAGFTDALSRPFDAA